MSARVPLMGDQAAVEDFPVLTDRETERLLHLIRSSLEVRRRSQFFLWAQGQLQSLIPHEVMICAYGDAARRSLAVENFASYPLAPQDVEGIADPEGGFMMQVVRAWMERGERPLVLCTSDRDSSLYRRFESLLFRHAFPNFLMHGSPVIPGVAGAYFGFANLPQPLTARAGMILEIVAPYIHMAYLRVIGNDREQQPEVPAGNSQITAREVEILQWVREGKSNLEIGAILAISPLTVKNHVQKILKKLAVQNRAQAVAKGIALGLIKVGSN